MRDLCEQLNRVKLKVSTKIKKTWKKSEISKFRSENWFQREKTKKYPRNSIDKPGKNYKFCQNSEKLYFYYL